MPKQTTPLRKRRSYRFNGLTAIILRKLSQLLGISETALLETLIIQAAALHGLTTKVDTK